VRLLPVAAALALITFAAQSTFASELNPSDVAALSFDRHVGERLPLDLAFTDEDGQHVSLNDYFGKSKPVILSLNYFTCQYLCPLETDGLINGLNGVSPTMGSQYTLLSISIDPHDGPSEASAFKARGLRNYNRPSGAAGWHLLISDQTTLDRLIQAVGFHALHDAQQAAFAHPVGAVILTADGTISTYLYGIDFASSDLASSLTTASQNATGSLFDRALLICYQYDPLTGRNTQLALNVMRFGGAATLLVTLIFLGRLWRADLGRGHP
jgi:protein SCO1